MPQVNLVGGPHGSFTTDAGTADEVRFEPYPGGRALSILKRAIWIIEHNIFKKKSHCNNYFKLLRADGTSRSFDEVWSDPAIWINFDPRLTEGWDGATNAVDGKEITLSQSAFQTGNRWYVTASSYTSWPIRMVPAGRPRRRPRPLSSSVDWRRSMTARSTWLPARAETRTSGTCDISDSRRQAAGRIADRAVLPAC